MMLIVKDAASIRELQSVIAAIYRDKGADQLVDFQLPGKSMVRTTIGELRSRYGGLN